MDEFLQRYKAAVPRSLSELIQKYGSSPNPVKCVIYDSILPWIFDVARSTGIFGASFFTQSCAVNALYYSGLQGEVIKFPMNSEIGFDDLPSFINGPGPYQAIYDLIISQFYKLEEVDWLLSNTFEELEDEVLDAFPMLFPSPAS
ncbi:UDP-glycosyltransferase 74F2 [Euphorbia peplus]|nr:UDP-glycosyltransferase 74F2 [Euphorbia peplus]